MAIPAHKFDEARNERVRKMAAVGVPNIQIARIEGIDVATLRKYYGEAADQGFITANVNIGRSIYDQAVGRPAEYDSQGRLIREELAPDKSCAIFLSKARLGLRETAAMEISGPDGGAININSLNLSSLTTEELRLLHGLLLKCQKRTGEGETGQ